MNDKEIGEIARKLHKIDPSDKLLNEFFYSDNKDEWIKNAGGRLEGYRNYTDTYKNLEDFMADKYKTMNTLYEQLGGVKPSDARYFSISQKYPNIDRKELNDWFDRTNQYKEDIKKERQQKADVERRKKEVEGKYTNPFDKEESKRNWSLPKQILTSDYEKQRYIHEPQKALFGYDAPSLGKAPETRYGAMADLAAGTAATAADFVPPAWMIGPAIRTGRDIAYNVSGSRYKKDIPSIISSGTTDLGLNMGARYLANARRAERIAGQMTDKKVASVLAAEQSMNNTKQAVKEMNPMNVWVNYDTDMELVQRINALPESHMKNELMQVVNGAYAGKPIDRAAIGDIASKYQYLTSEGGLDNARKFVRGDWNSKPFFGQNEFVKEQAYAPTLGELTNKQKASYVYNKLMGNVNKGQLGQIGVQGVADVRGRGVGTVNPGEDPKPYDIEDYVKNYSRFFDANFKPNEKEGDPIWEAYKIWLDRKERGL